MRDGFCGMPDEGIDVGGDCNAQGGNDPCADTDLELPAIEQCDIGIENAFEDAVCNLFSILTDHAREHDQEYVMFIPSHTVVRTALLTDHLCNDAEDVIPNVLAIFLVDCLEVIDIQSDQA